MDRTLKYPMNEKDERDLDIRIRSNLIREALFLCNKAMHKLQNAVEYYDCSKNLDFDDLHHNVHSAMQYLEFIDEELSEIADQDMEMPNES